MDEPAVFFLSPGVLSITHSYDVSVLCFWYHAEIIISVTSITKIIYSKSMLVNLQTFHILILLIEAEFKKF